MEKLIERLRHFRDARDWAQFHTPKDLAVSVSIEAAELLEIFQWRPATAPADDTLIERARSEAADVLLYLALLCESLDIDLIAAAEEKITRNERRFPVETARGVAKPIDQIGKSDDIDPGLFGI